MKISHPYTDLTGGQWLRGNLHAHSTRSDGERNPQAVIDDYARRGFGFLMLSDHDICTSRQECQAWSTRELVIIPGNEISAHGPHLLHVDADRFIKPVRSRQAIFNQINANAAATNPARPAGGFAIVNHPNWQEKFDHCTIQQMREWTGYVGMEIYNGVISRLDGSPYATNKWDILLSEGRRIWGFANDDSHAAEGDTELGWNTVYVRERSLAAIVEALYLGRFYPSTGVTITSIHVRNDTVRIETENAQRITALINTGRRIATADGPVLEVKVPPKAKYLRFECWGPGEKFAWTQPFFVEEEPEAAPLKPAAKKFLGSWEISDHVSGVSFVNASADTADGRRWTAAQCWPSDGPAPGLVDARQQIAESAGLVYFRTTIKNDSAQARRACLFLGYDGPVRVWINGKQIFEGPGANPCITDRTALYADLKPGDNRLTIALDTNDGKAWGVMARVEF